MSISSYYKERDKLFSEQRTERAVLLAHGISAKDIDKLHDDDYKAWKSNRNYALHNYIAFEAVGEEAISLILYKGNPQIRNNADLSGLLDSVENDKLLSALRLLNDSDLELIETCLINGVSHKEYADYAGKCRSTVTRKLERLRKRLMDALIK